MYIEYINVSIDENKACDIKVELVFSLNDEIVHQESFSESEYNDYLVYAVPTTTSWNIGLYDVKLTLTDQVSSKKVSNSISFVLSEKNLIITSLLSASEVRNYGDYDAKDDFTKGEKIYIYQEYEGFTIDETTNECNLFLQFWIRGNDQEYYYNSTFVTDSSFKGYTWWFPTDESWLSTQYFVVSHIMDMFTSDSYLKDATFTIS